MKNNWQVIVGNIGTTYQGQNGASAMQEYGRYIAVSKTGKGRVGGEDVTLIKNDEIHFEYIGTLQRN